MYEVYGGKSIHFFVGRSTQPIKHSNELLRLPISPVKVWKKNVA
jgi:hypothetical protein